VEYEPAIDITGEKAAFACAIPVTKLVAPGPFCPAKITPGLLEALAYQSAICVPVLSSLTPINFIFFS
jgi:hypothetical protein